MSLEHKIDITFTDFLYAVVAGSAFQHFTPYQWGWEDLILIAALLVLADDWVLYHAQAARIEPTSKNFAFLLLLDIVILLLWYSMARYGAIGPEGYKYFVGLLSVFYLVVAFSEFIFRKQTLRTVLMYSDLICFLLLASWTILLTVTRWTLHQWMVPVTLVILAMLRYKAWKEIVFESK